MKILKEATEGFVAVTDNPVATMFPRELQELYPDAKIIIVERDLDRWYASVKPLVDNIIIPPWFLKLFLAPMPTWRWLAEVMPLARELESKRLPGKIDRNYLTRYNKWIYDNTFNPDNRLVYTLSQGWEPLCKLLDKPVPNEPFPRANDAKAFADCVKHIVRTTSMTWLAILSTTGILTYGGYRYSSFS